MIEIVVDEESSCNGCGARGVQVHDIFISRELPGSNRIVSGTSVRLCNKCFAELLEKMQLEDKQ